MLASCVVAGVLLLSRPSREDSNAQNGSLVITTRQTTFYDFPLSLLRFVVAFPVQSDAIHSFLPPP